jgi:hypothetical protein
MASSIIIGNYLRFLHNTNDDNTNSKNIKGKKGGKIMKQVIDGLKNMTIFAGDLATMHLAVSVLLGDLMSSLYFKSQKLYLVHS